MAERCCICLDSATKKESIRLLDCGCEGGWFHKTCEMEWMESLEDFDYPCPTCRRDAPLLTNYSYSCYSGSEQKYLCFMGVIMCVEYIATLGRPIVWIFPWQSMSMLVIPFVFYSNKTLPFFLKNIFFHNAMNASFAYLVFYDKESYALFFDFCTTIGFLQLFFVCLFSLYPFEYRIDPLSPYAISREIKYKREITYTPSELITKTPTNSLKRNKSSVRRYRSSKRR